MTTETTLPEGYIRCLDHGFVGLVDAMGDDKRIVGAARLSISGKNVRPHSDDEALIRYLYRHRHTTPFEMVEFIFDMKMPIFVARQWVRHRTANINEMSARYSELPEEFYVPEPKNIQLQATHNKQGRSDEEMFEASMHNASFAAEAGASFHSYHQRLKSGMARELARINLPLSTYTHWHWKCDLHNIFHLLALRLHPHAQYEIRVFASAMAEIVRQRVPLAYKAFEDFRLNAMTFTAQELAALRRWVAFGEPLDRKIDPREFDSDFPTKREKEEFLAKIELFRGL